MSFLTRRERRTLERLAEAAIPGGPVIPAAGADAVDRLEKAASAIGPSAQHALRAGLWGLELSSIPRRWGRFSKLDERRQLATLRTWQRLPVLHPTLRALLIPLKIAYLADPRVYEAVGCRYDVEAPSVEEEPRWLQGICPASDLEPGEDLECDVVVVGTGAGGAPVAALLAERGLAVLLLEEGQHHRRGDFNGRAVEMLAKLYRKPPVGLLWGNALLPVPLGKTVGGTTTVNSGTCFRTPDRVLAEWGEKFGLTGLTPDELGPWFDEVERTLQVAEAEMKYVGGAGRVIARGCEKLGYSHGPLKRNAPGCDGQGLCCFGCPTDAKTSTNVSFVPRALESGMAQLITGVRVDRVLRENGVACGVSGTARREDGSTVAVKVRSQAVVLACGTLHTPTILLKQGLGNGSGQLGRNLSVHPATHATGEFAERIDSWNAIPQGYGVDQFVDEGIRFEGASVPLELPGAGMDDFGHDFVEIIEKYSHMAGFGFMVRDTSRGRVRVGPDGKPLATYWLNRHDTEKLKRGMSILCRIFLAAGAKSVHPGINRWPSVRTEADVQKLEKARIRANQFDLSAYHPLGTARMGADPSMSVVDGKNECHDVPNLYICDGSAIPSSLGVNPQITIMALACRTAETIHRRLEA